MSERKIIIKFGQVEKMKGKRFLRDVGISIEI